jgi:hypothetical protein
MTIKIFFFHSSKEKSRVLAAEKKKILKFAN